MFKTEHSLKLKKGYEHRPAGQTIYPFNTRNVHPAASHIDSPILYIFIQSLLKWLQITKKKSICMHVCCCWVHIWYAAALRDFPSSDTTRDAHHFTCVQYTIWGCRGWLVLCVILKQGRWCVCATNYTWNMLMVAVAAITISAPAPPARPWLIVGLLCAMGWICLPPPSLHNCVAQRRSFPWVVSHRVPTTHCGAFTSMARCRHPLRRRRRHA